MSKKVKVFWVVRLSDNEIFDVPEKHYSLNSPDFKSFGTKGKAVAFVKGKTTEEPEKEPDTE